MTRTAARLTSNDLGRAIGHTKLAPPVRFVFQRLTLRIDWRTGAIPEDDSPSLTDLCDETGYCRTTIRDALYVLEDEGWITRRPPPVALARREHKRTRYQLHYPGSPLHLRSREQYQGPDHVARRREMGERITAAKKRHKEAREAAARAPDWAARPELVELAAATVLDRTGREISGDDARAAVRAVLGGKPPGYFTTKDPGPYLVASIRKDARRFLPAAAPDPVPAKQAGAEAPAAFTRAREEMRKKGRRT